MSPKALRRLVKAAAIVAVRVVGAVILVVATLLLVIAVGDRSMPDLDLWHRTAPSGEFSAADAGPGFDLGDYLDMENRLFTELAQYAIDPAELDGHSPLIRYVKGGPGDPETFQPNWNRSIQLVPDDVRGGVLLVHGLSDSPYSMRSLARVFHDQGYYVLVIRMPGHGTVPGALRWVTWQDWMAAIEVGASHVRSRLGDQQPFLLGGYSNGGALAVLYTLSALDDDELPVPDRVFLFSPAIGITRLAMASNWHRLFSWIPLLEKSKWVAIQPEYDPFKYTSFPKNAGAQSWAVARKVQKAIARAEADGRLGQIPPIMTFQSIADSTIIAQDVVDKLYVKLPANGSSLICFDVNSFNALDGFYRTDWSQTIRTLESDRTYPFELTVLTNASRDSHAVVARTRPPLSAEVETVSLKLSWPDNVYSLAHVAIPFPPDDPVYGYAAVPGPGRLGDLAPRGEKNVLNIDAADLLRLRANPFHAYMVERILDVLKAAAP